VSALNTHRNNFRQGRLDETWDEQKHYKTSPYVDDKICHPNTIVLDYINIIFSIRLIIEIGWMVKLDLTKKKK
jgi:hypothetical protein